MKELSMKGALASEKPKGLAPEELPPLESHAEAKAWLEAIVRAVAIGRLEERPAQAAIRTVSEWVKAHEGELTALVVEELQDEVERLQAELSGHERRRFNLVE